MIFLKQHWGKVLVGVLGVAMLASVLSSVLSPPPTMPNDADVAAASKEVAPTSGLDERFSRPDDFLLSGNGVVEPHDRETQVSAAVPGRIASVEVVEGAKVRAGDPLILLEQEVEKATLAAAQADYDGAQADYARVRKGSRSEDIDAADAEATAALARATQSADTLKRTEALAANGHVTPDELDRARRAAEADKATADQADARRRAAVNGSRKEDVSAALAKMDAAKARRDEAAARLEQRTVRAPIDGEILQVLVRAGEYETPGSGTLLSMGDTSTLRVRMDVDERDIAKLKLGDAALLRAVALAGRDIPAKVEEIGRRMGRKNVRTDDPVERNDTKILEVVLSVDDPTGLVVGQRVVCYVGKEGAAP